MNMKLTLLTGICFLAFTQLNSVSAALMSELTEGIKSHRTEAMQLRPNIGIIVASDSNRSESGDKAKTLLEKAGFPVTDFMVVKNLDAKSAIKNMLSNDDVDSVICIGGTGISPHDKTVEAVEEVGTQQIPGYGEYLRLLTQEKWKGHEDKVGLLFIDTRANAVIANGKVVFAVPGSPDATQLAVSKIIIPGLPTLQGQLLKKH